MRPRFNIQLRNVTVIMKYVINRARISMHLHIHVYIFLNARHSLSKLQMCFKFEVHRFLSVKLFWGIFYTFSGFRI